jgi:hypothetical protein
MKFHHVSRMFFVIACLGVLSWSGCANFITPEIGAVARKEARIPLVENGMQEGVFETNDLKISYSLSGVGERITLSGSLVFDRSLTNSFPTIESFFLRMNFLDIEGRVIETVDITPIYSRLWRAPEKLELSDSRVLPAGSKAIAFNYFGMFRGERSDDSMGNWEIFHFPFD